MPRQWIQFVVGKDGSSCSLPFLVLVHCSNLCLWQFKYRFLPLSAYNVAWFHFVIGFQCPTRGELSYFPPVADSCLLCIGGFVIVPSSYFHPLTVLFSGIMWHHVLSSCMQSAALKLWTGDILITSSLLKPGKYWHPPCCPVLNMSVSWRDCLFQIPVVLQPLL